MNTVESNDAPSRPIVLASAAALMAGWAAAGSLGVLANPFGMALVYLLVTVAIASASKGGSVSRGPLWLALAVWLIPLITPATQLQTVLLVAATVGFLAVRCEGPDRDGLARVCGALLILTAYRWAAESIPVVWWASDRLGLLLGKLAGLLANRPLEVGASFAGLDFLVVSLTLLILGLPQRKKGDSPLFASRKSGLSPFHLLGILGAHLVYLILLARAWDLADWLPRNPDPTFDHPYVPPDWDWSRAAAALLPWNLPALGAILHVFVAAILLRSSGRLFVVDEVSDPQRGAAANLPRSSAGRRPEQRITGLGAWNKLLQFGGYAAAVLLPLVACFTIGGRDLHEKRILANGQGRLDWRVPEHGQFGREAAGTFGVLPSLVASLGGQLDVSNELSDEELRQTDILMLLRPTEWLTDAQTQRIWQYVRDGGSLLVVAGLESPEDPRRQAINQLLATTAIRVRRDVALSACDDWQAAGQALTVPALNRRIGRPVSVEPGGSSIQLGWRAVPLALGRWGWSDPGGDAIVSNIARCEPGEHLGDLVLAAEQKVGKGTVVVLGTERPLTNEGIVWEHLRVSRLLDYLAHRPAGLIATGRQTISAVLIALLLAAVLSAQSTKRPATIALLWASAIAVVSLTSGTFEPAVPDGRRIASSTSNPMRGLAYIDASHLELFSTKDWVFDGTNGLALNLMRNGYLTLGLTDRLAARLQTADVLVSMAPGRAFSVTERILVNHFVSDGGLLVCTVGAEQAAASRNLFADYGIRVPASPVATVARSYEPVPMGHLRSLYLDASRYGLGDYQVGVTFHAAWPVESTGAPAQVLVGGLRGQPVVLCRAHGNGHVVVVGDSSFAMNKNLEYIGGEPFNGRHENAHFWRWLISGLTTDQTWIPPDEEVEVPPDGEGGDTPSEVDQLEPSAPQEGRP